MAKRIVGIVLLLVLGLGIVANAAEVKIGDSAQKVISELGTPVSFDGSIRPDSDPRALRIAISLHKAAVKNGLDSDADHAAALAIGVLTLKADPVLVFDGEKIQLSDDKVVSITYLPATRLTIPFGLKFTDNLADIFQKMGNPKEYKETRLSYEDISLDGQTVDITIEMEKSKITAIVVKKG